MFKWKVMPFGEANTPALFQELMNKILSILRWRPVVQELISRGAQMEAHIDDVCLGTNTQEDHLILLGEFFAVCQENHTRLKRRSVSSCRRLCSTAGSTLAMGGGHLRPLRPDPWWVKKVRHEDPKKRRLEQAFTVDCFDDIVLLMPRLAPAASSCISGFPNNHVLMNQPK